MLLQSTVAVAAILCEVGTEGKGEMTLSSGESGGTNLLVDLGNLYVREFEG